MIGSNRNQGCEFHADKFQQRVKAHKNGLWHWTTDRQPHYEDLCGCKYNPPAPITWKRKPQPCHSWWFQSPGLCRWPHSVHWQPLWVGRSEQQKCSAKTWVLDFLKEMIVFLQQVSVGISGIIDEEQHMSTRTETQARTVIPALPKFTKGDF